MSRKTAIVVFTALMSSALLVGLSGCGPQPYVQGLSQGQFYRCQMQAQQARNQASGGLFSEEMAFARMQQACELATAGGY